MSDNKTYYDSQLSTFQQNMKNMFNGLNATLSFKSPDKGKLTAKQVAMGQRGSNPELNVGKGGGSRKPTHSPMDWLSWFRDNPLYSLISLVIIMGFLFKGK